MQLFTRKEHSAYLHEINNKGIALPIHQISKSFTEGLYGKAFINNKSSAIIVFDFVEFIGPFDKDLYSQILSIQESHIVNPSDQWKQKIKNHFKGDYTEYIRTSFKPFDLKSSINFQVERVIINNKPVIIKAITPEIAKELLQEEWSQDIVLNMINATDNLGMLLGFAAYYGEKLVGGIGCYTLYKRGIEIEIDIHQNFRRKGIAYELSKIMLTECKKRNLECHWDAMNRESALLAKKLGFKKNEEYHCLQLTKIISH